MELKNTVEMMCSGDYKERFRAEYFQLKIRIDGLTDMVYKYRKGALDFKPSCSFELLHSQLYNMKRYALALEERAEIEGIDLNMQLLQN